MLLSLHVKNLALIEEEEVVFTDGLNILTGETGAGKSIIIGSVNLGLGARAEQEHHQDRIGLCPDRTDLPRGQRGPVKKT